MVPAQAGTGGAGDDIDPHVVARLLGLSGQIEATPLVRRRGKSVWRIDAENDRSVLRVLRPDEHETAEHEQQVMGLARAAGLPVPEVLATATHERRPVLLLSWGPGRTLQDELRARPWEARRLGVVCGRTQAMLHRDDVRSWSGPPWVTRFGAIDDALATRLAAIDSGAHRLIHLDLHPTNILVDRGSVSALLDWTNATAGDPRADLARALSLLSAPPQQARRRSRARRMVYRIAAAGWRSGYEDVAGPQEEMDLFELWATTALVRVRTEGARWSGHAEVASLEREVAALRARVGLPRT